MMKRMFRYALTMPALLLAAPQEAAAQGFERTATGLTDMLETMIDLVGRPGDITNISLGLGPSISPDYEGSNDYKVSPVPVISLRYRDIIEVDNNEVKLIALNRLFGANTRFGEGSFKAGPVLSFNFGRGQNDNAALVGMGKVPFSFELGAFVSYTIQDSRIRLRIRQDVASGHEGGTAKLDFVQTVIRNDKYALSAVAATTWATAAYMKSYFGVTGTQGANTGYPVYRPGAGFKDVYFGLNANYVIARNWSVVASAGYARLMKKAANSPIVDLAGSPNQLNFSSFIVYSF